MKRGKAVRARERKTFFPQAKMFQKVLLMMIYQKIKINQKAKNSIFDIKVSIFVV